MSKRKLLLSGETIAELRTECKEFLKETQSLDAEYGPDLSDDSQIALDLVNAGHLPQTRTATETTDAEQMLRERMDAAVPTTPNSGEDYDSEGMPWDHRIHASSRAKTKEGIWRIRRGAKEGEVVAIENEIIRAGRRLAVNPVATPTVASYPPPPAFPGPVPSDIVNTPPTEPAPFAPLGLVPPVGLPPQQPVPVVQPPVAALPPQAPVAPAPVTAVVSLAHNLATFKANQHMVLAELVRQGKINQDYIASLKHYFNVKEIWEINDSQTAELFNVLAEAGLIVRMP